MKPNSKRPKIAKSYYAKSTGSYGKDNGSVAFDKAEKGHGRYKKETKDAAVTTPKG